MRQAEAGMFLRKQRCYNITLIQTWLLKIKTKY